MILPRGCSATSGDRFKCHDEGGYLLTIGVYQIENRGAADHPTMPRKAPQDTESAVPNAQCHYGAVLI